MKGEERSQDSLQDFILLLALCDPANKHSQNVQVPWNSLWNGLIMQNRSETATSIRAPVQIFSLILHKSLGITTLASTFKFIGDFQRLGRFTDCIGVNLPSCTLKIHSRKNYRTFERQCFLHVFPWCFSGAN